MNNIESFPRGEEMPTSENSTDLRKVYRDKFLEWANEQGCHLQEQDFWGNSAAKLRYAWDRGDESRKKFVTDIMRRLGKIVPYEWLDVDPRSDWQGKAANQE